MSSSSSKNKDTPEMTGVLKLNNGSGFGSGSNRVDQDLLTPIKRSPSNTAVSSSPISSTKPSRESSPIRPPLKPGTTRVPRSRKSSREGSPIRAVSSSTLPSASSVYKALSTANTPSLVPTVLAEPSIKAPRPQKPSGGMPGDSALRWPTSPRLRSPPPREPSGRSALLSPRKQSLEQSGLPPSIVLQGSTPTPRSGSTTPTPQNKGALPDTDSDDQTSPSGIRTPARGVSGTASTLETVQESSLPATPAIGPSALSGLGKVSDDDRPQKITENPLEEVTPKPFKPTVLESGSESGGNKSDGKGARKSGFTSGGSGTIKPNTGAPTKPFILNPRAKPSGEGSTKNMTVETETVSSIPQVAVGGGAGERGPSRSEAGGSIRQKASTETIRPKKEKKKTVRKAPSVTSGTGGSSSHIPHHRRHHHHHHHHHHTRSFSLLSSSSAASYSNHSLGHATFHDSGSTSPDRRQHSPRRISYNSLVRSRLTSTGQRVASSKADIFEAKIASAVDEANSSDSEETFVYESNPPEPHVPRSGRYHSRTPSVTSTQSQADQRSGMRSVQSLLDGNQGVHGKRSMKFTNNPYNTNSMDGDVFSGERADASMRSSGIGSGRGNGAGGVHHHHIGHHTRGGRGGHASIFADESPFPNATKPSKLGAANGSKSSSRPNSPRNSQVRLGGANGSSGKKLSKIASYELDPEGADDERTERTPLLSTVRVSRGHPSRRRPGSASLRQLEHNQLRQRRGWVGRLAGCTLLAVMLFLVISGALGFLFATTKALLDVKVVELSNVLASEQELMMDLLVEAVNPNVISVTVANMDISIFAKSSHIGKDKDGELQKGIFLRSDWDRRKRRTSEGIHNGTKEELAHLDSELHAQDDPISDPIPDPEGDSQTMLLGRIFEFDSALIFEGSPIQRHLSSSIGEVRLMKPGNKTEEGGSARWEKVLQHPFELIVRGVLKYQLPLSSRVRTAPVGQSVTVYPEGGVDSMGRMKVHSESRPYPPGSNVVVVGKETLEQ